MTPMADAENDAPLSVATLFAPVFAAVTLLHLTLLRLPYFWDEGGYYIPAAWDFLRLGTVIPVTTVRNAHPPLPSVLLAGWWKIFGFHILSTRLLMCVITTFALLAVFQLARMFAGQRTALAVMVLTAIYPVWFAQSTLAHADMFAAAFTLWALCFYADRPGWTVGSSHRSSQRNAAWVAVLFSLACMAKETAIVLPAALFCFEIYVLLRPSSTEKKVGIASLGRETDLTRLAYLIALAVPAVVLALWYAYHHHATGFTFGNPEYLRYNATANMSVGRTLLSLRHRAVHLTTHMNLWLPMLAAAAAVALPPRFSTPVLPRRALHLIVVLIATQWIAFSFLGGALLTRYVLPAYPLLLIACVAIWRSRIRLWWLLAAGTLVAFAIACRVNPPYPFAPEDNLAYRDMIVVHQEGIDYVQTHYAGATVLTAWPVLADLQRPELGYVSTPMKTTFVDNFSMPEMKRIAAAPETYDVAIVFSTKYDPPAGGLNLAGASRKNDTRFYDWHSDLLPGEAAALLHGRIAWEDDRNGEWAAVLVFPRGYDVLLRMPQVHGPSLRCVEGKL